MSAEMATVGPQFLQPTSLRGQAYRSLSKFLRRDAETHGKPHLPVPTIVHLVRHRRQTNT